MSQKKPSRIFKTYLMILSKTCLNSIISCISTSFKKEVSIQSHIAKKLQAIFANLLIAARDV